MRVDGLDSFFRPVYFCLPLIGGIKKQLALKICFVHNVEIDNSQPAAA
jgi:hypothetical protein